jgi:hypothetical protein
MAKKLGEVELFWLQHHMDGTYTNGQLAKMLGVTVRAVQYAMAKIKGRNRSGGVKGEPEPNADKLPSEIAPTPAEVQKEQAMKKEPGLRLDALIHNKTVSGEDAGAVAMTQAASMVGDDIAQGKLGPPITNPFDDESRVHKIRKDK